MAVAPIPLIRLYTMQIEQIAKTDFDDCRYCSLVYKTNREDPIGTVATCDHWLINYGSSLQQYRLSRLIKAKQNNDRS